MPSRDGPVHVATTKRAYKGRVYQTHLLRRSYREGGKVKHQTLGNLSHLPPDLIDTIRRRLRGEQPPDGGQWDLVRTLPHGHVAAVLGTLRNLGLDRVLGSRSSRERDLAIGMIVARVISPASKLATARAFQDETASTSLSLELGIQDVQERELYETLDWLGKRQRRIETKLAKKHLADGTLVLYDVSGSYYRYERLCQQRRDTPRQVRLGDVTDGDPVKLTYERKLLTDTIKMCAYDVETQLTEMLAGVLRRQDFEGRAVNLTGAGLSSSQWQRARFARRPGVYR